MKYVIAFALTAAVARAACPGGCSGHGSCGAADVCECHQNWGGGDCSLRKCSYGPSWSATSTEMLEDDRYADDVIASTPGGYFETNVDGDFLFPETFDALYPKTPASHAYVECSGRGTCDYSTGLCRCFEGFEGRGCRRTTCPNGCSGHGRCLTNNEINSEYTSLNGPNDEFWDQHRTQSCVCDRGFSGYDCSERICPFGDDPTTACSENSAADYQMIQATYNSSVGADPTFFTVQFTDMFGGTFTTRPVATDECTVNADGGCRELQYALMELPNFAIPEVEVDLVNTTTSGDVTQNTYVIHFSDASNTGKQNTVGCEPITDSSVAGAAPRYDNVMGCATYNIGQPEWYDDAGNEMQLSTSLSGIDQTYSMADLIPPCTGDQCDETAYEEFVPCSNKGICDTSTGTCVCAEGHFGEACEKQSTFY